jgi:hypothetical protein
MVCSLCTAFWDQGRTANREIQLAKVTVGAI